MLTLFPDLTDIAHIRKYASDHNMTREEIPQLPLGFSQMARLAKGHIQFNQSNIW